MLISIGVAARRVIERLALGKGEVAARELSEVVSSGRIVSKCGLFWSIEVSKVDELSVHLDSSSTNNRHAFIRALGIGPALLVLLVFRKRTEPEVFPAIVELVSINVVNRLPARGPHYKTMHNKTRKLSIHHDGTLRITICACVPLMLGDDFQILIVDYGDEPSAKSDGDCHNLSAPLARQRRKTRALVRMQAPHDAVDDAQATARGGLDVDELDAAPAKGAHSGLEPGGNGRGHA